VFEERAKAKTVPAIISKTIAAASRSSARKMTLRPRVTGDCPHSFRSIDGPLSFLLTFRIKQLPEIDDKAFWEKSHLHLIRKIPIAFFP
jgi:hypothetical protein